MRDLPSRRAFFLKSLSGVGINTFITFLFSLLFPLIVLRTMGASHFRAWVLASSVSVLVSLGELGIGNLISAEYEKLKRLKQMNLVHAFYSQIRRVFYIWIVSYSAIVIFIVSSLYLLGIWIAPSVNNEPLLAVLLCISNLIYACYSIPMSGFRAFDRFPFSQFLLGFSRTMEVIFMIASILSFDSLITTALILLFTRMATLFFLEMQIGKHWQEIDESTQEYKIDFAALKQPLLGNMFILFGNWLRQQGPQLIASRFIGLDLFVAFSLIRTFASGLRQISDTLFASMIPQLSTDYFVGNKFHFQRSINRTLRSLVLLNVTYLLFTFFFVIPLLSWWIGNSISLSSLEATLIVMATALDVLLLWPLAILLSANKHFRYSLLYCIGSLFSICSCIILGLLYHLSGLIIGLFFLHIVVVPFGLRTFRNFRNEY